MRRTTVGLALTAGLLGVTAGTAAANPALADAATGAMSHRVAAIQDALDGLVSDGTITQTQAKAVAETLDEAGPALGPGRGDRLGVLGPQTVADALGISTEDLVAAHRDGQSLAQVAEEQGIARDDLISRLVRAAGAALDQRVEDGVLTEERADLIRDGLTERITAAVDRSPGEGRGFHHRPGGHGFAGTGPEGTDQGRTEDLPGGLGGGLGGGATDEPGRGT